MQRLESEFDNLRKRLDGLTVDLSSGKLLLLLQKKKNNNNNNNNNKIKNKK